jgi:hypothetical protein
MKIKLEVELDTDKKTDLNMVEDVLDQLNDVRELLEDYEENLNTTNQKTFNKRKR